MKSWNKTQTYICGGLSGHNETPRPRASWMKCAIRKDESRAQLWKGHVNLTCQLFPESTHYKEGHPCQAAILFQHQLKARIRSPHCHEQVESPDSAYYVKKRETIKKRMVKSKNQGIEVSWVNHLLANKLCVWTLQAIDNCPTSQNFEVVL